MASYSSEPLENRLCKPSPTPPGQACNMTLDGSVVDELHVHPMVSHTHLFYDRCLGETVDDTAIDVGNCSME